MLKRVKATVSGRDWDISAKRVIREEGQVINLLIDAANDATKRGESCAPLLVKLASQAAEIFDFGPIQER